MNPARARSLSTAPGPWQLPAVTAGSPRSAPCRPPHVYFRQLSRYPARARLWKPPGAQQHKPGQPGRPYRPIRNGVRQPFLVPIHPPTYMINFQTCQTSHMCQMVQTCQPWPTCQTCQTCQLCPICHSRTRSHTTWCFIMPPVPSAARESQELRIWPLGGSDEHAFRARRGSR